MVNEPSPDQSRSSCFTICWSSRLFDQLFAFRAVHLPFVCLTTGRVPFGQSFASLPFFCVMDRADLNYHGQTTHKEKLDTNKRCKEQGMSFTHVCPKERMWSGHGMQVIDKNSAIHKSAFCGRLLDLRLQLPDLLLLPLDLLLLTLSL